MSKSDATKPKKRQSTSLRATLTLMRKALPRDEQGATAIEYAMVKYKRVPGGEPKFRPEHFGDHQAKAEAIRRILRLDDSQLTTTFRRVRAFSGINNMIGRTQPLRPSGLGNWDNSCYQNSVLQGLASLPTFRTFISLNLEQMGSQYEAPTHRSLLDLVGRLSQHAP